MKIIFHIDCDNFFTSAEISRHKEYSYDDAIVIAPNRKHGLVLSASKTAKNMGINITDKIRNLQKKVPMLIVIKSDLKFYQHLSWRIFSYVKKAFANKLDFRKGSIDECYIDFTNKLFSKAQIMQKAQQIQKNVWINFRIPISIGISKTTFYAKMATRLAKPQGIFYFRNEEFLKFFGSQKIDNFYGLGENKALKLKKLQILTIKDLSNANFNLLYPIFKNQTSLIVSQAKGQDFKYGIYPSKNNSFSRSITIYKVLELESFKILAKTIINEMIVKLKNNQKKTDQICIKVIYIINGDYKIKTKSQKLVKLTQSFENIFYSFNNLYEEITETKIIKKIEFILLNLQNDSDGIMDIESSSNALLTNAQKIINKLPYKFPLLYISKKESE